jgi:hypothetical protein
MVLQMPRIFPLDEATANNRIISVPAPGNVTPFSTFMSNTIFDLSVTAAKAGTQCFPRYLYDEEAAEAGAKGQGDMLASAGNTGVRQRRDALTDEGLAHFQAAYPGETITKDDLFYYVYGLLHSEDYRRRFADTLSKQLPRIPAVKAASDFWAFVEAGRRLGDLHCNYEEVELYPVTIAQGDLRLASIPDPERFYRVEQMKFAGKRPKLDKSTVIYNANITMTGIPLEAYDYVVNGKPALEWVMERQCVKTDKASGIANDANRYAMETVGNPTYPLDLFQRVITVSLETMKIVERLPSLEFASTEVQLGKARNIDKIKSGIMTHWRDAPAASIALAIIDGISALIGSGKDTLRVSDILTMLDVKELSGDIVAALTILVQSEFAMLRSGGEFLDKSGRRYKLSPEDFQRVLALDTVVHPVTQIEFEKASHQVVPIFELATELFGREK